MATISVIVPMHQVEDFVLGCLQSLQAQTFKDFECICVDDGSPDKSGEIAQTIATQDKRFRVVRQKNEGLSMARNTGLSQTTAPYVFFLDADDYLHPQTLEILLSAIKNADISNCGVQNTTEKYHPITEKIASYSVKIINNPLKAFLTTRKIKTGACFRLYRRNLLLEQPFIKGIHFEDIPFTTELLDKIKTLAFVDLPLYYYYQNPASIMHSNFTCAKIDSYNTIIRHLYDYFQKRPLFLRFQIQRYCFNNRIKMIFNQIIHKEKEASKQLALFEYAQPIIQKLYQEKIISYKGLKVKHKVALWLLTHQSARSCHKWCRVFL